MYIERRLKLCLDFGSEICVMSLLFYLNYFAPFSSRITITNVISLNYHF